MSTCFNSSGVLISGTFLSIQLSKDLRSMGCRTSPAMVSTAVVVSPIHEMEGREPVKKRPTAFHEVQMSAFPPEEPPIPIQSLTSALMKQTEQTLPQTWQIIATRAAIILRVWRSIDAQTIAALCSKHDTIVNTPSTPSNIVTPISRSAFPPKLTTPQTSKAQHHAHETNVYHNKRRARLPISPQTHINLSSTTPHQETLPLRLHTHPRLRLRCWLRPIRLQRHRRALPWKSPRIH